MNKEKLKETLLQLEFEKIENLEEVYHSYINDSDVITGETHDLDEVSQNRESAEMSEEVEDQLIEHEDYAKYIQNLTFHPSTEVEPGAVIKLNGRFLVVSVPTTSFMFEGQKFIGISTDAPLYKLMHGKSAGDKFSFRDREMTIEEIY